MKQTLSTYSFFSIFALIFNPTLTMEFTQSEISKINTKSIEKNNCSTCQIPALTKKMLESNKYNPHNLEHKNMLINAINYWIAHKDVNTIYEIITHHKQNEILPLIHVDSEKKLNLQNNIMNNSLLPKQMTIKRKILEGHQGWVNCVIWSPDNKYTVSGSSDKNLIMWNVQTGEQIYVFKGHKARVMCAAWSLKHDYIVSGANNGELIIWDAKTKKQIAILQEHQDSVRCVALSPDGNYIVSGSDDKTLILWDAKTKKRIAVLNGHQSYVKRVAWSPNSETIISTDHNTLFVWNIKTEKLTGILKGHNDFICYITWTLDGEYIITGSTDRTLIVWDGIIGKQLGTFTLCNYLTSSHIEQSPDHQYIASGSLKNILLWDNTEQLIACLEEHKDLIACIAWSPNGKQIASCANSDQLIIWDVSFLQKS